MIDRYLDAGEMRVLAVGGAVICETVVLPLNDTACELQNLATDPPFQGQGHATRLLNALFRLYAARYAVMVVGTTEKRARPATHASASRPRTASSAFSRTSPQNPSW